MTFEIKNGRLLGVPFVNANASGGTLRPTLIILHDTAGRLEKGSSVNWFKDKTCTVSAHVVVERDGTITQMVPFNRRAWHAGKSAWQGKQLCNSFAIGIEIVNPGLLDVNGRAWFHKDSAGRPRENGFDKASIEHAKTREHGEGWWMPYTPEQIEAVKQLCRALIAVYPEVNDIATHWQVSPGRKIDTNPLFPLTEVEDYAFGRVEPETIDVPPVAIKPAEKEIEHMGQSSEGNAAVLTGGISTVSIAQEASAASAKVAAAGQGFSFEAFLLALMSSTTFWVSVITLGLSAYMWLRRRHRFLTKGV